MSRQSPWQPHRPKHLSTYAEFCLEALADRGLGAKISVGGAIGLLHYWDYRPTHDVDARWIPSTTQEERQEVSLPSDLARIAQHRPLAEISDPAERASAQQVRHWFAGEFLDALVD